MALGGKSLDLIFELNKKNFFKDVKSVLDMGDQDLNINYDKFQTILENNNLEIEDKFLKIAKKFPQRPRLSSSIIWRYLIGINNTYRLDLREIERHKEDNFSNFIQHDLNYPFDFTKNKAHFNSFDLVTDFGNNEHPFNISETYKTMHNFSATGGILWVEQSIFGGNGFYNFDKSYFLNLAAVNNYSILFSCFYFVENKNQYSTPFDYEYLKKQDLNKLDSVNLIIIMRKNNNEKFNYPYQGTGKFANIQEIYSLKEVYNSKTKILEYSFLPTSIDQIKTIILLKSLIKKIVNKFRKIFKI